jgi:hypothetical protein
MQRQRLALAHLATRLLSRPADRTVILGGPRSGKSTLAQNISRGRIRIRGTDELLGLGWSDSSLVASSWFEYPGPWICEGVTTPRALRKWLARNHSGLPADRLVWNNHPVAPRNAGQETMAKGCATVWLEIADELESRGAEIITVRQA